MGRQRGKVTPAGAHRASACPLQLQGELRNAAVIPKLNVWPWCHLENNLFLLNSTCTAIVKALIEATAWAVIKGFTTIVE